MPRHHSLARVRWFGLPITSQYLPRSPQHWAVRLSLVGNARAGNFNFYWSMTNMKRKSIAFASILALTVGVGAGQVLAQQGMKGPGQMKQGTEMGPGRMMGMPGRGMMGMGDCPMMGMMTGGTEMPAFGDGRTAFLKAELAITPAQQAVWDAYAAALKKNFTNMQGMRQSMMTALEGKTPVEKLDAHLVAIESRHGALKEIKPALGALYAALSDAQKQKADQILTGMGCMM